MTGGTGGTASRKGWTACASVCCACRGFRRPWMRTGSPAWRPPRRCSPKPVRRWREAVADLPDIRQVFGRVWGRGTVPAGRDSGGGGPGQAGCGGCSRSRPAEGGMLATDFVAAEAVRLQAAPRDGRDARRFRPAAHRRRFRRGPLLADAPTVEPVKALWTSWAPWTFLYNLTRQPRDHGAAAAGCGRVAAIGAAGRAALPRRPGAAGGLGD